ncbi:MAG: TIGR02449 family protein [Gammaproteobacteria bacterium]|nr:TIGR02449 family protein [Gammaproteobacteria bacterium]
MEMQQLKLLEQRVEDLIRLRARPIRRSAPQELVARQLRDERAQLLRKNEDARSKVEAMIGRLRSLEQES